jgi:hypothetical protein
VVEKTIEIDERLEAVIGARFGTTPVLVTMDVLFMAVRTFVHCPSELLKSNLESRLNSDVRQQRRHKLPRISTLDKHPPGA